MLSDLEKVKAALRAGARPQQVFGTDNLTRRYLKPDTIVHGPDGDVLVLVRWGRVAVLGRTWDQERDEHRSRSPCVKRGEKWVSTESKEADIATLPYAPNP